MKEQLEQRLKELNAEFESGQKMLQELETRTANMRTVIHRISGAIQVLEEELAKARHSDKGNGQPLAQGEELANQSAIA